MVDRNTQTSFIYTKKNIVVRAQIINQWARGLLARARHDCSDKIVKLLLCEKINGSCNLLIKALQAQENSECAVDLLKEANQVLLSVQQQLDSSRETHNWIVIV